MLPYVLSITKIKIPYNEYPFEGAISRKFDLNVHFLWGNVIFIENNRQLLVGVFGAGQDFWTFNIEIWGG